MKHIVLRLIAALVLLAAILGIAFFAYNAGVTHPGVANPPAPAGEANGQAYPYFGYAAPFWHPFPFFGFGCLGLLVPLFLLFVAFGAFRWMLWGPRWGWRHMHHFHGMGDGTSEGVPPMFSEWHRRAHGETQAGKQD